MGRQDLAYQITVNDAQLRLATQHVAAFNAELERSTVTGQKLDKSLATIGSRSASVGSFLTRNVTVPLGLAGIAAGKLSADFESSLAKISGLTNTSAADTKKLGDAAIALSSTQITEGPSKLADALFRLKSVGFSTAQAIAAIKPISEAAAAGLGDTETVAYAVGSAMDAYGFKVLSANQATAVLIGTITKGNLAPASLAAAIGRVVPLAVAMGLSFDQVGAAIASMSRQGLNANLAVTGLRALLQGLEKAQPGTQKAFAAIGTSAQGVAAAIRDPSVGLFPTMVALRKEFDALGEQGGKKNPLEALTGKDLAAGAAGNAAAIDKIKEAVGGTNEAMAHAFPNIRGLISFLILTGPRRQQNASIFATLKSDALDAQDVIKKAYTAKLATPIGQLDLQISRLKAEATTIGPTFINAATGILSFFNGVEGFLAHFQGLGSVLKPLVGGLLLIGPLVSIFGRATQVAGAGVGLWGKWQASATEAAFAVNGVSIAEDKATIASRKAAVQMVTDLNGVTTAADAATAAVSRVGRGVGGSTAAVGVAGATGGVARVTKASGGVSAASLNNASAGAASAAAARLNALSASQVGAARVTTLQAAADEKLAVAEAELVTAQERLIFAQKLALPSAVLLEKERLAEATATVELARSQASLLFPSDTELVVLLGKLAAAQNLYNVAVERGVSETAALGNVQRAQQAILQRQAVLAGGAASTGERAAAGASRGGTGSFAVFDSRAKQVQQDAASSTAAAAETAEKAASQSATITASNWSTAMVGMKTASKVAFDFIAFSFAADLASKVIFSSHKTRDAVVGDLASIQHQGVGSASALALIGVAAYPVAKKAATAFGGGGGLAGALESAGIAASATKVKMGLLIASVLGLQAAGAHMGQVFNVVMIGMAANAALVKLNIIEAGAAFGPVGLAAATAATVFLVAWQPVKRELLDVGNALDNIFNHGHNQVVDVPKGFKDALDNATLKQKLALQDSVKAAGNNVGKVDSILAQFTTKVDAAIQAKQVSADAFAALEKGLPIATQKAAENLRKGGNEYAAEQLLAQASTAKQLTDVKAAVAELKSKGQPGLAALLQSTIADPVKTAQKAMDQTFQGIETSVLGAFDAHTQTLLDVFDRQTSDMLDAFDRQTTKLEDALKVTVKAPSLHETFTVTVNGKTPAERQLDALDKLEQRQAFQNDILDAHQQLAAANDTGDPAQIQKAKQAVEAAENERKKFILSNRADTERTLANKALDSGKTALDNQRAQERQGISDARDSIRKNIDAQRSVEAAQIKSALTTQQTLFDNGKIGLAKYYADVQQIMAGHNITFAGYGKDAGTAYAGQFQKQLDALAKTISLQKLIDQLNTARRKENDLFTLPPGAQGFGIVVQAPDGTTIGPGGVTTTPTTSASGDAASTQGVPTRPAIKAALDYLGTTHPQVSYQQNVNKGEKALPQRGQPNYGEYENFLQRLPTSLRNDLEGRLQGQGFFRAAGGGVVPGGPPWHDEGPQYYQAAYKFFRPYAVGGNYTTPLTPDNEGRFETWLGQKHDAGGFDPTAKISDYDMRGFWRDDRLAAQAWTQGHHFPDRWKTPYDTTFSHESQYATRNNPFVWKGNDLVNGKTGRIIFSPRAEGGRVNGPGVGDVVPAMLTPGEIVLNRGQQSNLSKMLGVAGLGPHGLFSMIASRGQHFAEGGVGGEGGGESERQKLLRLLALNALKRNKDANAGIGGPAATAPVSIESLIAHHTRTGSLTRAQKLALEGGLAQAQAHPVATGLIDVPTRGAGTLGSRPHFLDTAPSGGSGGGITVQGDINVNVASDGGNVDVDKLLGDLRRKVAGTPRVRGGRSNAPGRLGVG